MHDNTESDSEDVKHDQTDNGTEATNEAEGNDSDEAESK